MNKFFALLGLTAVALATETAKQPPVAPHGEDYDNHLKEFEDIGKSLEEATPQKAEISSYKYCGFKCRSLYRRLKKRVAYAFKLGRTRKCKRSFKCRRAVEKLRKVWAKFLKKWHRIYGFKAQATWYRGRHDYSRFNYNRRRQHHAQSSWYRRRYHYAHSNWYGRRHHNSQSDWYGRRHNYAQSTWYYRRHYSN